MKTTAEPLEKIQRTVQRQRLVDTALRLLGVPSRTGEGKAVADCLADILLADGFTVERPTGGYPEAPAVAVRWSSGKPGKTLQFNGHLDTVHLPFVPPAQQDGKLFGSGSADMKAGLAAAVEALRTLRQSGLMPGGSILLTAHDLHETPWGDGRQLDQMIRDGYVGDAVLLPEYLNEQLAVIGRGGLTWRATIRRPGPPVHEVMRPRDEPSVIAVAATLIAQLIDLEQRIRTRSDPLAGSESLFIGQVHSGEIFNQFPQECFVEGTRRWLPGTRRADVEAELQSAFDLLAKSTKTTITARYNLMRDAFYLDQGDPLVEAFQAAHQATAGRRLPIGAKPFCDDGNSFWHLAKVPAITHGPQAGGAHTLNEWVSIDDLVRVAGVYALTALAYCGG